MVAASLGDGANSAAEKRLVSLPRSFETPTPTDSALALIDSCSGKDALAQLTARLGEWLAAAPAANDTPDDPDAKNLPPAEANKSESHRTSREEATGRPALPTHLASFVSVVEPDDNLVGRDEDLAGLLTALGRRTPATPLVVAPEGAGRTALLRALAERVARLEPQNPLAGRRVVRVSAEAIISGNRAQTLRTVISGVNEQSIVCIDDLEVIGGLGSSMGADLASLSVLRGAFQDASKLLVLLLADEYLERLRAADRELVDETEIYRLDEIPAEAIHEVAERYSSTIATHHGVSIPSDVVRAACAPPGEHDRVAHPSLALLRMDQAAAKASLAQRDVTVADLPTSGRTRLALDRASAIDRLNATVIGQRATIEAVVDRLVVTRAEMDARPERPDGVFLFVGPTGVGKTALAHALAEVVFGDAEAILRLDMSEYAEPHTVAKLVGSPPGYVGSTDPEGWLSTRIRANPNVVLLLDEIEKAHPQVWNAFLQVFDAGRLTDSQGVTALFHDTVVVLTSNIGAGAFGTGPSLGFGDKEVSRAAESRDVVRAVKQQMPPELINRLDEVLVFSPLSRGAVHDIAKAQLAAFAERMRPRGYELEIGDEVVDMVVEEGFSREYGARPLQRAIERLLVSPLATLPQGHYRAVATEGRPSWTSPA